MRGPLRAADGARALSRLPKAAHRRSGRAAAQHAGCGGGVRESRESARSDRARDLRGRQDDMLCTMAKAPIGEDAMPGRADVSSDWTMGPAGPEDELYAEAR